MAVLIFSAISGDQFLVWGWRVPFWLSIVMVGVGLYIRLGILETPVFQRVLEAGAGCARAGYRSARTVSRGKIILTALARMAEQGPVLHFRRLHLHLRDDGAAQLARSAADRPASWRTGLSALTIPLARSHISDRSAASACI